MKYCKHIPVNNYRYIGMVLISFYILLTFGCSAQKDKLLDTKFSTVAIAADAVNINTATEQELEKLPYIGATLAKDIVEYRIVNGNFRKPEHLMLIQGISDKRFRQIRPLIRTQ